MAAPAPIRESRATKQRDKATAKGSSPTVAFAVAYRAADPQRITNWAWVKAQLVANFPDWPIFEEPSDSPHWNKQTALNRAIARAAKNDLVVIYDSDCFLRARDLHQLKNFV